MQISGVTAVGIILVAWACGVFAFLFGVVLEMVRRARRARDRQEPRASNTTVHVPAIGDARPIAEVKRIPDEVIVMAEYAHHGKSRDLEADAVVEFRAIERVLRRRDMRNSAPQTRGIENGERKKNMSKANTLSAVLY